MAKSLKTLQVLCLAILWGSIASNSVSAQVELNETLQQIEQYNQYKNEGQENSIYQITNVNQLQDVAPTDWSYEAIRSLTERYGCISGFDEKPVGQGFQPRASLDATCPDRGCASLRTFKGDRPITRNEFAAGLNSCFEQIERSISSQTKDNK